MLKRIAPTELVEAYPVLAAESPARAAVRGNLGSGLRPAELERVRLPEPQAPAAWTVPGLAGPRCAPELEGIVVGYRDARAYWPTGAADGPPRCFAPDAEEGRGTPGGPCEACPLAQFGSAPDGRGQACRACRRLWVLLPGRAVPVSVTLPPASLGAARRYFVRLAGAGLAYWAAVTRIGLAAAVRADGTGYRRATFRCAARLECAAARLVDAYRTAVFGQGEERAPGEAQAHSERN